MNVSVQDRGGIAVHREWQSARQEPIEQRAGCVHIGRRCELVASCLLRRDVRGSSQHLARSGCERRRTSDDLGDPQVRHLERAATREHEVLGFDIAVQHAVFVRMVEPGTQRQQDRAGDVCGEPARVELGPYRAAGEMFHDQEAQSVVFHEVVDGNDMRVIERCQQACFGEEAFGDGWISAQFGRQLLDGHHAAELTMTTRDHNSRSAVPEFAADLVCGERALESVDVEHLGRLTGGAIRRSGTSVTHGAPRPDWVERRGGRHETQRRCSNHPNDARRRGRPRHQNRG